MESHKAQDQLQKELRERITQFFDFDPSRSPNYNIKLFPNLFVSLWNPTGYHVCQINTVGGFNPIFTKWKDDDDEVEIIEPLVYYRPVSLIALFKKNSIRSTYTLKLENTQRGIIIDTGIRFEEPVLSCTSNKDVLAVCLEHYIYVYSIKFNKRRMKATEVKFKAPKNKLGLCALAIRHLAYPGLISKGVVEIRNTSENLNRELYLHAHEEPMIALAFNTIGTRLATASHQCIRVFFVGVWQKIYEFRRDIPEIPNLYFSFGYLTCSSKSATIHIFKLEEGNKYSEASGVTSVGSDKYSYSLTIQEPHPIQKVVAVKVIYQVLYVFVINDTGVYVVYKYNPKTEKFTTFGVVNMTTLLLLKTPMTPSNEDEDFGRTL